VDDHWFVLLGTEVEQKVRGDGGQQERVRIKSEKWAESMLTETAKCFAQSDIQPVQ